MGNKRTYNSAKVPSMSTAFPQAVIADKFVFLSGTPGLDPSTGKLSEGFEGQVRQALSNIGTILEEVGSGLDNIVKTTVFMVAGNDFAVLNKVYSEFFPIDAPARSTPQVNPFPGGILVSIECIAVL
jgi:2-iminobutanoate/2-iminopropanoate deaminase